MASLNGHQNILQIRRSFTGSAPGTVLRVHRVLRYSKKISDRLKTVYKILVPQVAARGRCVPFYLHYQVPILCSSYP